MTSIIEESRKARGAGRFLKFKNKKIIIALLVVAAFSVSAFFYLKNKNGNEEVQENIKTWSVKKSDLSISIESDGKVVAEDGVELSFSVSADTLEVSDVYVKEGDVVAKGDKIASVKTDDLRYDLNKANASYQSVLAGYNELVSGATATDIAKEKASIEQASISLEQAEISLAKTKSDAESKISDAEEDIVDAKKDLEENSDELTSQEVREAYEDLVDVIKSINISLDSVLVDSDEILGIDNIFINEDFKKLLGAKNIQSLNNAEGYYWQAKTLKDALNSLAVNLSKNSDYKDIDYASSKAEELLEKTELHLFYMKEMLENTITSSDFSQSELDGFKASISSNRNTINSKITNLTSSMRSIKNAKDGLDDYLDAYKNALKNLETVKKDAEQDILTSEANVKSKEISLKNAQINYDELIAPPTEAEIASTMSQLTSARITLQKAQDDLNKATIISPIDGKISLLNYKIGDIILTDDNEPVVEIINDNTLFIEVKIEEADINKIKAGQKAYATFDALNELKIEGEVNFISLTSETDNSGIVTYLVRILLNNDSGAQIREGMTAFVDFIISEAEDVLIVPVNAVRNVSGKASVELAGGEIINVTTGFTDGKYVEIISGLKEGDQVLY